MKYKLSPNDRSAIPHKVTIEPYDPQWPLKAAAIAQQLAKLLGDNLITVEHIGSTSIPGLAAKPVIDLLPIVRSLERLDRDQRKVIDLGYTWRGEFGINGRRLCGLSTADGIRLVHIHFYGQGSEHILRHLAFRDYLLAHPHIAKEYEAEKRRAAQLHPDDSLAYNDEKAAWVQKHERAALEWY